MALLAKKLSSYGIPIGFNTETDRELELNAEWLRTGLHVIGPTGCGKTRLLTHIFRKITKIPNATIFVLSPAKPDLYDATRDAAIADGLTSRLILVDLGDPEFSLGYDKLRPNGLPIATQAKSTREGVLHGSAQLDQDQTPQRSRIMYMIFYVARTLELGMPEAVRLLMPRSPVRKFALANLPPSYIRDALVYFDSLPDRRQEELAASTLARLEPFVFDPSFARTFTQRDHSLDLAQAIREHKIVDCKLAYYQHGLLPDDQRLFGRLFLTDILAHVFERTEPNPDPVFLFIDEVEEIATQDLCRAFDLGRGMGLCTIIAHQHLSQLVQEDKTSYLLQSVMHDARTKIIFGGGAVEDLERLTKEVLIDQYSPWTIKDEVKSLELDPRESTRRSYTRTRSHARGQGVSFPQSESWSDAYGKSYGENTGITIGQQKSTTSGIAHGTEESRSHASTTGKSRGRSVTDGTARTTTRGWAHTTGRGEAHGESEGEAVGHVTGHGRASGSSQGANSGVHNERGYNMTLAPDGDLTRSYTTTTGSNSGSSRSSHEVESSHEALSHVRSRMNSHVVSNSEADTASGSEAHTRSTSVSAQETESESQTLGRTVGSSITKQHTTAEGVSVSREVGRSHTDTRTKTQSGSRGVTPSVSEEEGWSESETEQPFYEYKKRRVVSSRTFLSEQEFLTLGLQRIKGQPRGHFVIKVPGKRAVFARAPFIKAPHLTARQLARARERIFAQPCYTKITDSEIERQPQLALPYQEAQEVNDHATSNLQRSPRKPRRTKTPPEV